MAPFQFTEDLENIRRIGEFEVEFTLTCRFPTGAKK
jgi:hypothetical protein